MQRTVDTSLTLEDGRCLACAALEIIYAYPSQPDPSLSCQERDAIIRTRHAAGVSQADLARQAGISYPLDMIASPMQMALCTQEW